MHFHILNGVHVKPVLLCTIRRGIAAHTPITDVSKDTRSKIEDRVNNRQDDFVTIINDICTCFNTI